MERDNLMVSVTPETEGLKLKMELETFPSATRKHTQAVRMHHWETSGSEE